MMSIIPIIVRGEHKAEIHPMIETEDYIKQLPVYSKTMIHQNRNPSHPGGQPTDWNFFCKIPTPFDPAHWAPGEAEAAGLWPTDKVSPVLHAFKPLGME